jgi:regulator of protease activity HflC (stomatin/prohibitin superfamily)
MPMSTKQQDADQRRQDAVQAEADRQTHLVDPMTHPSSGDPPPAMTPAGERLGAIPVHANAQAELARLQEEGRQQAHSEQPKRDAARAGTTSRASSGTASRKPSGTSKAADLSAEKTQQPRSDAAEKPAERTFRSAAEISTPSTSPPFTVTKPADKG